MINHIIYAWKDDNISGKGSQSLKDEPINFIQSPRWIRSFDVYEKLIAIVEIWVYTLREIQQCLPCRSSD